MEIGGFAGIAASVLQYGTTLLDHALLLEGITPQELFAPEKRDQLLQAIKRAEQILDRFYAEPPKGYIWQIRQGGGSTVCIDGRHERSSFAAQSVSGYI